MALKGTNKVLPENVKSEVVTQVAEAELPWKDEEVAGEAEQGSTEVVVASNTPQVDKPVVRAGMLPATAEADGFEALDEDIGFGSFPMVKLDKGIYECGKTSYQEFNAVILSARPKWIYKSGPGDDAEIVYSYDQANDTNNRPLKATFDLWKSKGCTAPFEGSRYMECAARFLTDGPHKGKMVLLNVAPKSISRLAGHRAEIQIKHLKLSERITRVFPGDKVEVTSKKSFHPWNFEDVGPYEGE